MPAFLVGVGIVFYGVAVDFALEGYERVLRRQRVESRQQYSSRTIYSHFYANSGVAEERITRAWKEAASILQVDAGRLRPGDRLSGMLGFHRKFRAVRSDINVLIDTVNLRLDGRGKAPASQLETFHDVVWQLATLGDTPLMIGDPTERQRLDDHRTFQTTMVS